MSGIQAIETRYNGHRFRSRLEARWAVFFDSLGLPYEYEKEGFLTSHGPYLPDFYLPTIKGGLWVEVKPVGDDRVGASAATCKVIDVCTATGKNGIIVRGDPMECVGTNDLYSVPGVSDWSAWAIIQGNNGDDDGVSGPYDAPYVFCVCPYCSAIGLEFDGRGERVCSANDKCNGKTVRDNPAYYGHLHHGDKAYSWDHPRLMKAAERARSARFEHGERP